MVFYIGLFAVFGSLFRYGVGIAVAAWPSAPFPIATLTVNLVGCFALSLVHAYVDRERYPEWLKNAVSIGFIGSFTTFSAFGAETMILFQNGLWGMMAAYIFTTLIGGLGFAMMGRRLGRRFWEEGEEA